MRYLLSLLALLGLLFVVTSATLDPLGQLHWWLFNTTPPRAQVSGPTSPVSGTARFSVHLEPTGRAAVVRAALDGVDLPPSEHLAVDTALVSDGSQTLVVVAEDTSRLRNRTEVAYSFVTDNTPPRIEASVEPPVLTEGQAFALRVTVDEPATLEARLNGEELPMFGEPTDAWALVGVPPSPGYDEMELWLEAVDRAGNRSHLERRYTVAGAQFPMEEIVFPSDLEVSLSQEVRDLEREQLLGIYTRAPGLPRWDGPFALPLEGEITTPFGTRRSYNGGPPSGHHAGVDFAAPFGAPVVATQTGEVVFAGALDLRGNTVILDHGAGVFSTYAHLDEILVEERQVVTAGEVIGLVGSTGLSTGPHLHWEIWVGGADVDPIEWLQQELILELSAWR